MRRGRDGSPGFSTQSVSAHPAMRSLGDLLGYLLTEAGRPASALARSASQRAAEALVLDGFAALDASEGAHDSAADAAARRRVRLACAFIEAHSDEPLTVAAIAEAVGIGARALQVAFRDVLGRSPRALLAETRLERARARLLSPSHRLSVADAAFASGFVHLGRFAAAYRQRFGEAPSDTLRRVVGPDD
jgi:transcriptional regulator GlxA family with amidase domain